VNDPAVVSFLMEDQLAAAAKANKVVWILGAGFSRPLGGPLLNNLFTPVSWELTAGRYGSPFRVVTPAARAAHWLYNSGRRFANGRLREWKDDELGADLWSDAEQFLEIIDAATGSDAAWYEFRAEEYLNRPPVTRTHPKPTIEELSAASRRLLAAECFGFLPLLRKGSERSLPFKRWLFTMLAKQDAVITFNYDRAVEQLKDWYGSAVQQVQQISPSAPARDGLSIPLIKLHGSVDWRRDPSSGVVTQTREIEFALKCTDEELAIASPGPNKLNLSGQLKPMWDFAVNEIRAADAIVIIGYRLPHGDGFAREQLLEALVQNDQPHLELHVALGPNIADAFTLRLLELLRRAMAEGGRLEGKSRVAYKSYSLNVHSLFGEDFLSAWNRQSVLTGV